MSGEAMTDRIAELRTADPFGVAVAVVLCAGFTVSTWARGAFFDRPSTIFLGGSLLLAAAVILRYGAAVVRREDVTLLALAVWWLISANLNDTPRSFVPLGASFAGVLAGSLGVRVLESRARRAVTACVVAVGSVTALVGLVACDIRWYPEAMRGQDLWRLAGTLTYPNAAGLLTGMALALTLGSDFPARWRILSVAACSAGLVASESRGAMLATAVAGVLFLRSRIRRDFRPVVTGVCAGLVTIAGAHGLGTSIPALIGGLLVLIAGCGWSLSSRKGRAERSDRSAHRTRRVAAGAVVVVALAVAGILARTEIATRSSYHSIAARTTEWHLALQQFTSAPLVGVGPDKTLTPQTGGVASYFAHNEYLQVLADAGLVGAILLLATVALVAYRLRHRVAQASGPVAALLVFALAGVTDYSWHLPALGLCAGITLGLAADTYSPTAGAAT